jgi:hypothetical protein
MATSDPDLDPTAALDTALAEEPLGAEAVVRTLPLEFWAVAEDDALPLGAGIPDPPAPPFPPVEVAAAEAEPAALDAVAVELAPPPGPPVSRRPDWGTPPTPPAPPVEVAVADAAPVVIEVVAFDVAEPPAPGGTTL